jgi:Flp pilus assembly secretin CpaC
MRLRTLILFAIALLLAGGTAILVRSWLSQRPTVAAVAPAPRPAPQESIMVARAAISRGQILKPADLAAQPWPDAAVTGDYVVAGTEPAKSLGHADPASRPASTIFVASPDIVDVQIKSPELIYVSAKTPGQTVSYAVDGGDTVLLNAPVRADFDLSELHQSLNRLVPGTDISVTQMDSSLVLSGAVASAGQAEKARVLAAAVAGAVKGGQVIKCFPDRLELQSFTKSVTVRKDDRRRANRG